MSRVDAETMCRSREGLDAATHTERDEWSSVVIRKLKAGFVPIAAGELAGQLHRWTSPGEERGKLYVIPRNSSLPYRRQARFSHGKRGKRGQEGESRRGRFDWWSRAGPGVGAVKLVMGCGIDKVARVKDMTMSLLFGLIELIHWLRSSLVGLIE